MPMLVKVPEKPAPITVAMPCVVVPSALVVSTSGMPAIRPNASDTSMMEMNGWTLNFEMSRIITTMAMTNAMMSAMPSIAAPLPSFAGQARCRRVARLPQRPCILRVCRPSPGTRLGYQV